MTALSRESIQLLLRLLESSADIYGRDTLEYHGAKGDALVQAGLVVRTAAAPPVPNHVDDEDGAPVSAAYDRERDCFGYHDRQRGWVTVDEATFHRFRPDIPAFLLRLLREELRIPPHGIVEIVPWTAWEVGQAWLGRRELSAVWFARRLHDRKSAAALANAIKRRPSPSVRLVLTSTSSDFLLEGGLAMTRIIPVADVLSPTESDIIDFDALKLRFSEHAVDLNCQPVYLSEDGRTLILNGRTTIQFRGSLQIALIRKVVETYRGGNSMSPSQMLRKLGSSAHSFDQAFGKKWRELSPFMRNEGGAWRLEP